MHIVCHSKARRKEALFTPRPAASCPVSSLAGSRLGWGSEVTRVHVSRSHLLNFCTGGASPPPPTVWPCSLVRLPQVQDHRRHGRGEQVLSRMSCRKAVHLDPDSASLGIEPAVCSWRSPYTSFSSFPKAWQSRLCSPHHLKLIWALN